MKKTSVTKERLTIPVVEDAALKQEDLFDENHFTQLFEKHEQQELPAITSLVAIRYAILGALKTVETGVRNEITTDFAISTDVLKCLEESNTLACKLYMLRTQLALIGLSPTMSELLDIFKLLPEHKTVQQHTENDLGKVLTDSMRASMRNPEPPVRKPTK